MSDTSKEPTEPPILDEDDDDPEDFCECWYGAFVGGDPRAFKPDEPEGGATLQGEWDAWENDCRIWDEWALLGKEPPPESPAHKWVMIKGHPTHLNCQKYGLGLNLCPEHTPPGSKSAFEP